VSDFTTMSKPCIICGVDVSEKFMGRWMHRECVPGFRKWLRTRHKANRSPDEWIAMVQGNESNADALFLSVGDYGITLTPSREKATRWADSVTAWKYAELASEEFAMSFQAVRESTIGAHKAPKLKLPKTW
jgi:hypothetical protein